MAAQSGTPVVRPAEPLSTEAALLMYVQGDRAVLARNAPAYLPPIWRIADDLERLPKPPVVVGTATFAENTRAVATFALEAARDLETQDPGSVCRLAGLARKRWVPPGSIDEFAHRWHAAAIATLLRTDCLSAIDQAVTAALDDFPTDPRFRLARAEVAEQQMTAILSDGHQPSGRELRDTETRFKIAMALPAVAPEAALRWARVNALLGRHEQAVVLAASAMSSADRRVRYLAHLFRGWSLAALEKLDEADAEYASALAIVPNAQTATLGRAASAFRKRDTTRADQLVSALIAMPRAVDDPWWTYGIGDGHDVDQLLAELRKVIR